MNISDCLYGRYIACINNNGWFIGNVIEISDQNQEVHVKFMAKSLNNDFNCLEDIISAGLLLVTIYALLFHSVFRQQAFVVIIYLIVNLIKF